MAEYNLLAQRAADAEDDFDNNNDDDNDKAFKKSNGSPLMNALKSPLTYFTSNIHHYYPNTGMLRSPPLLSRSGTLIILLLFALYSLLLLPSFRLYYKRTSYSVCIPPDDDLMSVTNIYDDFVLPSENALNALALNISELGFDNIIASTTAQPVVATTPAAAAICAAQQKSSNSIIDIVYDHPRIVHLVKVFPHPDETKVWNITIMQYLSILSAWKALGNNNNNNVTNNKVQVTSLSNSSSPLVIYLHSNLQPVGNYWDLLRNNHSVNVVWLDAQRIPKFGNTVTAAMEHEADYHKINRTFTYGGLHIDFDVFLINGTKILELQRKGECVLSVDVDLNLARQFGVKRMFNAGFFSCARHSPYLKLWRNNYASDYRRDSFLYNSGVFPTQLAEEYPYPLAEDWQVGMHWRPELLREPASFSAADWLNMTGIHFYHLEHEPLNWSNMLTSSSVFAQVSRYIQFGSPEPLTNGTAFPKAYI